MSLVEQMLASVIGSTAPSVRLPALPFPRLPYVEAMEKVLWVLTRCYTWVWFAVLSRVSSNCPSLYKCPPPILIISWFGVEEVGTLAVS